MKLYAIFPGVVCAMALLSYAAFADSPTTPSTAAKPATTRAFNYSAAPVSLLVLMGTLPDDEKTKIQAIDDKLKTDSDAARTSSSKEELRPKIKVLQDQANADIAASLTADQTAAIENYAPAVELLASSIKGGPGALGELNITSDQLNKLKGVADDRDAKLKALKDELQQKATDLNTAAKTQASGVLTDAQKAMLDAKPARANTTRPAATPPATK